MLGSGTAPSEPVRFEQQQRWMRWMRLPGTWGRGRLQPSLVQAVRQVVLTAQLRGVIGARAPSSECDML